MNEPGSVCLCSSREWMRRINKQENTNFQPSEDRVDSEGSGCSVGLNKLFEMLPYPNQETEGHLTHHDMAHFQVQQRSAYRMAPPGWGKGHAGKILSNLKHVLGLSTCEKQGFSRGQRTSHYTDKTTWPLPTHSRTKNQIHP